MLNNCVVKSELPYSRTVASS